MALLFTLSVWKKVIIELAIPSGGVSAVKLLKIGLLIMEVVADTIFLPRSDLSAFPLSMIVFTRSTILSEKENPRALLSGLFSEVMNTSRLLVVVLDFRSMIFLFRR